MKEIFFHLPIRGYLPTFLTNRKMRQLGGGGGWAGKMNSTIIRIVTTKAAIEDKTLEKHQKSRGLNIDLFHNAGTLFISSQSFENILPQNGPVASKVTTGKTKITTMFFSFSSPPFFLLAISFSHFLSLR